MIAYVIWQPTYTQTNATKGHKMNNTERKSKATTQIEGKGQRKGKSKRNRDISKWKCRGRITGPESYGSIIIGNNNSHTNILVV